MNKYEMMEKYFWENKTTLYIMCMSFYFRVSLLVFSSYIWLSSQLIVHCLYAAAFAHVFVVHSSGRCSSC